jgi:hypothetical protein
MTKLELLYAQQKKMFAEICELAARDFGYGELTKLSGEDRNQVENEAEQHIKEWEEMIEFRTSPVIRP